MKTKTKLLVNSFLGVGVAAVVLITSCKKDNTVEILPAVPPATSGDVVDARIGGYAPSTYTTPGSWKVDKTHSNIGWSTKYYGSSADLTGRFNNFDIKVLFDAVTPSNTDIRAWVQLSSFNTGEPGRDGAGKCGPGYMGVKWDTLQKSPLKLGPQAATDTAWFRSTSCERYGDGFLVKGDFTFRGITRNIEMHMRSTGKTTTTNTTSGKKTDRLGLVGTFGINALTVFGITSTSIADLVTINVNCNLVTNSY